MRVSMEFIYLESLCEDTGDSCINERRILCSPEDQRLYGIDEDQNSNQVKDKNDYFNK